MDVKICTTCASEISARDYQIFSSKLITTRTFHENIKSPAEAKNIFNGTRGFSGGEIIHQYLIVFNIICLYYHLVGDRIRISRFAELSKSPRPEQNAINIEQISC